jgi:hypothetical protein
LKIIKIKIKIVTIFLTIFWVESSEDTTIKDIIERHKFSEEIEFLNLLNGKTVKVKIETSLKLEQYYSDNVEKPVLWAVLLHLGYLTLSGEEEYKKNLKNVDNQNVISLTKKNSTSIENANEAVEKSEEEKNANEAVEKLEEKKNANEAVEKLEEEKNANEAVKKSEKENMVYIKIPNEEILGKIYNTFISNIKNEVEHSVYNIKCIKGFVEGLYEKDLQSINKNLSEYLLIFSSHHLYVKKISKNSTESMETSPNENVYQVLLMQMFLFNKVKDLYAEKDSGLGRIDFGFPNCKNKDEFIIIEVKVYSREDDKKIKKNVNLSKLCKEAINQIDTKKYITDFKFKGYKKFIEYGIAFNTNECLVEMKIDDLEKEKENEGAKDDNKTNNKTNNKNNSKTNNKNNNKNKKYNTRKKIKK